jgi:hypothetical protein
MYYLRARYYRPDTGRFWTMDTYEGSSEDPLSLHKYLYCQNNAVNIDDLSGFAASSTSGNSLDAQVGKAVEKLIKNDFAKRVPGGVSGPAVLTILKRALAAIGMTPNNIGKIKVKFPDLVDVPNREVFEIKPVGWKGTAEAVAYLAAYIALFNALDPRGGWHVGNTSKYMYCPCVFMLAYPPAIVVVSPPVEGLIYYSYQTPQQYVKRKAVQTAVAENAEEEDSVGIATLDGMMGAL